MAACEAAGEGEGEGEAWAAGLVDAAAAVDDDEGMKAAPLTRH